MFTEYARLNSDEFRSYKTDMTTWNAFLMGMRLQGQITLCTSFLFTTVTLHKPVGTQLAVFSK